MTAARDSFASPVRTYLKTNVNIRPLINRDILSSIRAAAAAKAAIAEQVNSVHRTVAVSQLLSFPKFQAVSVRLDALHIAELEQMASDLATSDALVCDWSDEGSAAISNQLEADFGSLIGNVGWSIEEKINYLIDWTRRQDDARVKQMMVAVLLSLVASFIFWLSIEVIPATLSSTKEARPPAIVREVRGAIKQQPIPPDASEQLRIVARHCLPVMRVSRRRSDRIASLHAGTLVCAREKRGKWLSIAWTDLETGRSMEGWVLSKYVARVSRRDTSMRFRVGHAKMKATKLN